MVAFTAGAVLTAANLNSAFNALTIRTVTGTSDTLVLADNGGAVTYSNASPVAVTVPLFSSIAYATGTKIVLVNLGAGTVTVAGAGGVTVNGSPLTLAQNAGATLIKTATNTWSFLPFSSGVGAADFSDTATGSYTGYKYKTFTGSGTLTVTTAGFADIVVCGGGGGGSTDSGGGGGGGGVLQVTNAYLPVGTLTVKVGAGGAGATVSGSFLTGNNGEGSRIGDYYALGGGGGGNGNYMKNGVNGGSGGGGAGSATGGVGGTGSQGFNGGTGWSGINYAAGGGGGASANGAAGLNGAGGLYGGAGGAGTTTTIAGQFPTTTYTAGSYALGGGGGGGSYGGSGGTGGSGGGGAGNVSGAATNGTANTGGGGGGTGRYSIDRYQAGNGGSGIVIVRVAV